MTDKQTFEISNDFLLNGKPFKIISGGFHYFRTVPEYWKDRFLKLKALGCNTVETYMPWNLHEPRPGEFDFSGMLDLEAFISLAQEMGLYVILRPGPYICAEWEFGGLPAWLLKDPNMQLRSSYSGFIEACDRYVSEVIRRVGNFQVTKGGPIIMIQYENEYGYFGEDKEYLGKIRELFAKDGVDVPFFTSDGPWCDAFSKGNLDGDLPTFNFGSKPKDQYEIVKDYLGDRPYMCMEFWVGWFAYWGGKHTLRDPEDVAKDLDELLSMGHVNFFMFQGGTNFGFTNGGNDDINGKVSTQRMLAPTITSYDYDALLTEAGEVTEKYLACQKVIKKYRQFDDTLPPPTPRKNFGSFERSHHISLFDVLDVIGKKHECEEPVTMECLDQNFGYILYRTKIPQSQVQNIDLVGARDRVHYYVNQQLEDVRFDTQIMMRKTITFPDSINQLDLLVENMGRINFGQNMNDQGKGIRGPVLIDGQIQKGFEIYSLPMDDLERINFSETPQVSSSGASGATFSEFRIEINEPADCYLDLEGFVKGFAAINGFNLGRFWKLGPQKRLYIPAPLLKKGQNSIIVFESEGTSSDTISLVDEPLWSAIKGGS